MKSVGGSHGHRAKLFRNPSRKPSGLWKPVAPVGAADRNETLPSLYEIRAKLRTPNPERIFDLRHAMQLGLMVDDIYQLTGIDPWFLRQLEGLLKTEKFLKRTPLQQIDATQMLAVKRQGFSDRQIAYATGTPRRRRAPLPQRAGGDSRLQNRRHLRRRI